MFAPLRFPSFHSETSEKLDPCAPQSEPPTPGVEKTAVTSNVEIVVDKADDKEVDEKLVPGRTDSKKLERRRSRMGMLAHYIFPSLTPEPADQAPLHRKPVPAFYPDASMSTPALSQNGPTHQQHSRSASIPNILRKVRKASPDIVAHADEASPLPPKHFVQVPPAPIVVDPLGYDPRLKKIRERTRSNSLESPQEQSRPRPYDGASSPRMRSNSAQPPIGRNSHIEPARLSSVQQDASMSSRSHSRNSSIADSPHQEGGKLKKLFGRGRSGSQDLGKKSGAWIMGPDSNVDYDTSSLINGHKVSSVS